MTVLHWTLARYSQLRRLARLEQLLRQSRLSQAKLS